MDETIPFLDTLGHNDRATVAGILQRYGTSKEQEECVLGLIDSVLQYGPSHSLKQMERTHMVRSRWLDEYREKSYGGGWAITEWTNALQSEAGEAGNIAKKIRRGDFGPANSYNYKKAIRMLADELADTLAYISLLCGYYDIDLDEAVIRKFDSTSEKFGYSVGNSNMMGWGDDEGDHRSSSGC